MKCGKIPGLARMIGAALFTFVASNANAQQVQVSRLTNPVFGTINNFTTDLTYADNVCIYSSAPGGRYHVTATGSGTGGAFTLASGANLMAYDVQWAAASGQTTGTALTSGVASSVFTSNAVNAGCTSAPTNVATLLTILRTASVGAATSGSYTGILTLLVAPN